MKQKIYTGLAVLLFLLVECVFTSVFPDYAMASSPQMDASCTELYKYGFSVGLVYCVQQSIGAAVLLYVGQMQKDLAYYEAMALTVAIALFGIKVFNASLKNPRRETMVQVFRILLGLFFFNYAATIYTDIAGSGGSAGVMGQGIGWIMGTSGATSGNPLFNNIISSHCPTPPAPPPGLQGYQVWQAFDCMFQVVFGAVASGGSGSDTAFATSMVAIVGACILSGTMGVIIFVLAISAFTNVIMTIARALYMVLLAYLCIGFLTVFAPLFAPLLFFDSKLLTDMFKRWCGLIVSVLFQPMFVIGFLALAVIVEDQLIEGNLPGCFAPTMPGSGTEPYQGWGQNGSGVCSFTQLFCAGQSGSAAVQCFNNLVVHNYSIANMQVFGSPQARTLNGSAVDPNNGDLGNTKTGVLLAAQGTEMHTNNILITGTHTKEYVPLRQYLLTLVAFIFISYIILKLLDVIPAMASAMTLSVGVNLYANASVPFQDVVSKAVDGAGDQMLKITRGSGLMSGNFRGISNLGNVTMAGVRGTIGGIMQSIDGDESLGAFDVDDKQ